MAVSSGFDLMRRVQIGVEGNDAAGVQRVMVGCAGYGSGRNDTIGQDAACTLWYNETLFGQFG